MGASLTPYARAAADLQWLLSQPPLARLGAPLPSCLSNPTVPTQLSSALHGALDNSSPLRLGRYAELLIAWWLSSHPRVADLREGLTVRDGGRTLGEFDFLFRLSSEPDFHHLELSVKYFLGMTPDWLGLNPQDRLATKLNHMRSHQLPLSRRPEAANWLRQRGIKVKCASGLMLGILFYPLAAARGSDGPPAPEEVTPNHLRGWWCRASMGEPHPASAYLPLHSRLCRLAPTPVADAGELLSFPQAAARGAERPLMVSRRARNPNGQWPECDRGVIVPDHWPVA